MKISYNWLKQYINIDVEPDEIARLLTDCGLEVESIEKYQSVKGGLEGVVIGEVITKAKHPDADRLSITTVDIGKKELLHIVCGASNVDVGQKVLVATIGAVIYNKKDESFEIKKSKIRGQVSEGMICAEDELGLGTSHEGIMVLDSKVKVGTLAKDYFNVIEDVVFEIGLTPNRADAISHYGVARDLFAVLNCQKVSKQQVKLTKPSVEKFNTDNNNKRVEVIIEDIKACPRYSGLTITDVEIKESPDWLKNYLKTIGLRPINNIVDITNFVMYETGQPLHAFDADEIKGDKVIVKKLAKGSKFITLDEVERELTGEELMICNVEEGMCMAGVFGGLKSGVNNKTKHIFLESACFDSATTRKTAKHHVLNTDSSFRFERGTDPNATVYALKRAALLIKEIAGGNVSSDVVDVYPKPMENISIEVSYKNMDRLIGKTIERNIIKNISSDLEMKITSEDKDRFVISVPTFKVDVTREADIIEEILRIYGYNNIEIPSEVRMSLCSIPKPDKERIQHVIFDYLSSNGFYEIMCNSLTTSRYTDNNKIYDVEHNVNILNPLSKDLNVLRQSLLFGGLETIAYNQNRKNLDLKLYEFGNTYHFNSKKEGLSKYIEEQQLALFLCGRQQKESWNTKDDKVDFYDMKSYVNAVLKRCGINNFKTENNTSSVFCEALAYYSDKSAKIVEFGAVDDKILKQFDIKQEVYYAQFNWNMIIDLLKDNQITYREIPKFPEVRRDLALLVDKHVLFAEIEKIAFETEKNYLKNINLFDVYEGENIEQGKKSYAVSFTLLDAEKTLTDETIDKVMHKLINAFQEKINASIR